jgi:putative DNA primase/helicase
MPRTHRPARSRRDAVTLPPDSEITQYKALAWLLRRPGDPLVEARFFQSPEHRAIAEAAIDLGDGAQAEAIVEAAANRGPARESVESALGTAISFDKNRDGTPTDDRELAKAVRELRSLWAARAHLAGEITSTELNRYSEPTNCAADPTALFIRADQVVTKPLEWLWPDLIPLGKLTLFAGRPKAGKSVLLCDIAARVSRGTSMPYAERPPAGPGRVVVCMAEDDPEDMSVPRLIAAGADLRMLDLFRGEGSISISRGIGVFERLIAGGEHRLIILDPVMSFIGGDTDTNNDASVREALWPIKTLAKRYGVAVILNSHQRKDSGDDLQAAAMGSTAFTGVPRATFAICRDPRDSDRKLLIPTGVNLAKDPKTLAFSLRSSDAAGAFQAVALTWEDKPLDLDERGYRQLVREQASRDAGSELTKAMDFLDRILGPGPMASKTLEGFARGEAIAERTLDRARKELGCTCKRLADGTWMVGLPGAFGSVAATPAAHP